MSISPKRKENTLSRKTVVEIDTEKVLDQLFPQSMPALPQLPQRRIRKTITMGDGSHTTFEYLVTVDPKTGEQNVEENISTDKSECENCGRLTAQLHQCPRCGKEVCGFCWVGRYWADARKCVSCDSRS
jgi:hypothetical protein